VRDAALEAMARLHFAHSFDPLTRIFREHDDARVKEVALESLGRTASLEAGEFLLEVLRYEAEPLRQVARRLLLASPEFLAAMRKIAPSWKPESAPIDPALVREACPSS